MSSRAGGTTGQGGKVGRVETETERRFDERPRVRHLRLLLPVGVPYPISVSTCPLLFRGVIPADVGHAEHACTARPRCSGNA